jgi:hypothetical protein
MSEDGLKDKFNESLQLAEAGNPASQGLVARMYLTGTGTAKDGDKAEYWARKAAEQNDPIGQLTMGELHAWGLGSLDWNANASFEWFTKAAEQGVGKAMGYLGAMLLVNVLTFGRHIKQPIKGSRMGAYYWFSVGTRPGLNPKRMVISKWISRLLVSRKEAAIIHEKIKRQGITL